MRVPAILKKLQFRVFGMDCAEEVSLLRRELGRVRGVSDLTFDVVNGMLTVEFNSQKVTAEDLSKAIHRTGMRSEVWSESTRQQAFWHRHGKLILSTASGLFLVAAMSVHAVHSDDPLRALLTHETHGHDSIWMAVLASAAIVAGSWQTIPKAIASMRQLRPDMNALICISILGAAVLGEWLEGATLAFLYALAGSLEAWSISRARKAVSGLIQAAPGEASVIHNDHEHRVPVADVAVGSIVRVRPGERVPFDGEVVTGQSGVNQAIITGESVPVLRQAGDSVFAGSINGDGVLEIRTTRPASDTTIARIVRMVSDSNPRRSQSEQFVNQFARVYTPVMIGLALTTVLLLPLFTGGNWSYWFYQGMVILLISCPCALVISTPVSIVAALASAAREGILIKGGVFLEMIARLKAIAIDKTGVLTHGQLQVRSLVPLNGHSREDVLARVAALEYHSEHPIARAIVQFARLQGIAPAQVGAFQALPGRGAVAEIDGTSFWAGSSRMLRESLGRQLDVVEPEAAGETMVFCGSGQDVWGMVRLEDQMREGSAEAIRDLRQSGIGKIAMLTGDNAATARSIARKAGIDDVRSELLPEDKVSAVGHLRQEYGRVAMVGDGLNDVQAMDAASVGIAFSSKSSDVALETADIILMKDDLRLLPLLVRHSHAALRIIKQNIAFALVTKAVFLVAAFTGHVTLWMAVAADMGATLIVTLNGLRMLRASKTAVGVALPQSAPCHDCACLHSH
jgi:Cd2+/Zn2+-exporting ATPase